MRSLSVSVMPIESNPADEAPASSTVDIAMVLLANSLLRVANAASGALIGFYLAHLARIGLPMDAMIVGNLGVVTNGAELLFALPMGALADRYRPQFLLLGSALLGGFATQIFGITHLVTLFFLSRALEGIAAAGSASPLLAHLADRTRLHPAFRGKVMSGYELSLLSGLALGALVAGVFWEWMQTNAFSLIAVVYALAGGLFYWGARGSYKAQYSLSPLRGLLHAGTNPFLRKLAPSWIAVTAIVGMWLTHIAFQLSGPPVARQYLVGRFTPREAGVILLGYALVFSAGVTIWGYALARISRLRALQITLTAMLIACFLLALLNHGGAFPLWGRDVLVTLTALSVMVESGFTPTALAYLADIADQGEMRGAAMGIYSLLMGIGGVLGAWIGGVLADRMAFDGLIVGTVVLALLALAYLPGEPQN